MEIILSKQCESLQGAIGRGYGYFIVRRGKRFFSQRSRHSVQPDGHWCFIVACANIALNKLHIADIKVEWLELQTALYEAKHFIASEIVRRNYVYKCKAAYNAKDIINLKKTFGL